MTSDNLSYEVENALIDTLNKDLSELFTDFGEIAIDAIFNEDSPFQEIPVVKSIIGMFKFGLAVNNHLFMKKILKFLSPVNEIPKSERDDFVSDLYANPQLRKQIGENLILMLDRLDNMQKPELLGKAFQALIEDRIDHNNFINLSYTIDKLNLAHLPALKLFSNTPSNENSINDEIFQDFVRCGLAKYSFAAGLTFGLPGNIVISDLGSLFVSILLD
ncbi:MAG: hypothetical protein PVF83_05555 [Anaerolineales bacterium]